MKNEKRSIASSGFENKALAMFCTEDPEHFSHNAPSQI